MDLPLNPKEIGIAAGILCGVLGTFLGGKIAVVDPITSEAESFQKKAAELSNAPDPNKVEADRKAKLLRAKRAMQMLNFKSILDRHFPGESWSKEKRGPRLTVNDIMLALPESSKVLSSERTEAVKETWKPPSEDGEDEEEEEDGFAIEYEDSEYSFRVQTTYVDWLTFLANLQRLQTYMLFKKLEITSRDENSDVLEATFVIAARYILPRPQPEEEEL